MKRKAWWCTVAVVLATGGAARAADSPATIGDMVAAQAELQQLKSSIALQTQRNELLDLRRKQAAIEIDAGSPSRWTVQQMACGASTCAATLVDGLRSATVRPGSVLDGMTVLSIDGNGVTVQPRGRRGAPSERRVLAFSPVDAGALGSLVGSLPGGFRAPAYPGLPLPDGLARAGARR